jgi:hypothetical protein
LRKIAKISEENYDVSVPCTHPELKNILKRKRTLVSANKWRKAENICSKRERIKHNICTYLEII